ncbi:MAG: proton-conducting membrane transporter, partial [Oscillospiraceae bacterium]|nr:proton-conducting membrane transporter [Oscillospiraceae bacterium]
ALLISALLTAAYLLPFSVRAFLTSREDMCVFTERDRDPGLLMLIPFAILSAAILALSFCSEPLMRLLQQIIAGT